MHPRAARPCCVRCSLVVVLVMSVSLESLLLSLGKHITSWILRHRRSRIASSICLALLLLAPGKISGSREKMVSTGTPGYVDSALEDLKIWQCSRLRESAHAIEGECIRFWKRWQHEVAGWKVAPNYPDDLWTVDRTGIRLGLGESAELSR